MKNWNKRYLEFWKPLITTNGYLDEIKIMKELADFDFIIEQLPKVYCHVTGGLLSKHMYSAQTVIDAHDDNCHKDCINVDDLRESLRAKGLGYDIEDLITL